MCDGNGGKGNGGNGGCVSYPIDYVPYVLPSMPMQTYYQPINTIPFFLPPPPFCDICPCSTCPANSNESTKVIQSGFNGDIVNFIRYLFFRSDLTIIYTTSCGTLEHICRDFINVNIQCNNVKFVFGLQ